MLTFQDHMQMTYALQRNNLFHVKDIPACLWCSKGCYFY